MSIWVEASKRAMYIYIYIYIKEINGLYKIACGWNNTRAGPVTVCESVCV